MGSLFNSGFLAWIIVYRSLSAARQRLKVDSERPNGAEVCSKASCLSKSVFSKECVHCTFFFFCSWTMRSLIALRLLCSVIFFFFGSTLNSGPHARTKHSAQSGVFVHFFLLFFSCQLTIHSRALRMCLCRELQAADKKNLTPNVVCFRGRHSGERLFEEGNSTNRFVQIRTCRVPVHSSIRRSTLSEFFHQACWVYEVFVDRLFFQLFFFFESVETEITQECDQKRHQKRDFETRTRISAVWLESDCLSIADFSSRQLGFVDAHKNLQVYCGSPVM